MGVPELLKFAAKAPSALTRIRGGGVSHTFDYVMIDGTNVLQTVGVEPVVRLISSDAITIRESVFILFDSQRDRTGTAREQRSHLSSHSVDVVSQQLCGALADAMKRKGVNVFVSGREVEGEADFKLLHLQRGLVTAAKAQNKAIPTFLFVSEDSDVLSGALCGPAPGNCWIATRLRDATHELCLLSVDVVTAWLTGVGKSTIASAQTESPAAVDDTELSSEEVVPSRHKKDGPMIGMGTATYFADSDDEDNPSGLKQSDSGLAVTAANDAQKEAAQRQQSASVDLILLFLLLKGSGYLPPIVKGATKVDMSSIWSSYMQLGRNIVSFEGDNIAFDGNGLSKVLQSGHLFDSMSRPANAEEIACARRYLTALSKTLLRGVLAFRGPRGALDTVDGRGDQIVETPSLAAFYSLLKGPDTFVARSSVFPAAIKPVANPIEESMMALGGGVSRPVPAPLALPTLKVSVVQQLASSDLSTIVELYLGITVRDALTAGSVPASLSGASSVFSFDLRRMVSVDTAQKTSSGAVLAAAGLSTGYSYAIDPAKVLARLRPNQKQPVPTEPSDEISVPQTAINRNSDVPTSVSSVPTVGVKTPIVREKAFDPLARLLSRPHRKEVPAAGASVARKGKKRMGKKERQQLARKMAK